ncbi:hypothetical protein FG05_35170 [Fusarium graminearum]|nr:hypothetical protein FG05_35170 [Fusarium graminearum]
MHQHVIIAGGFGRSPYVQTRIKQAVYKQTPSAIFHYPPGDQGCTAVSRGAVLRGLQEFRSPSLDCRETHLYVTSRIIRASYGVALYPKTNIIWLLKEGERSSAIDHHRVSLPLNTLSTIIANGSVNNTVWLYCKPGDNLHEKPFCTITWSRVGPRTEHELGFEWDNFRMEVSILREGRKVDGLSIEYHPHAWAIVHCTSLGF